MMSIIIALLATHGVLMLSQLSAAASATAAPAPMGLRPRCDTWCGHVRVPYPFGISLNCSYPAPGFNLTCDRSTHPPRLLLGDGTLHVDEISLLNSTVRVVSTGGVRIGRDGIGMWRGAGMVDDDAGPFALMSGDFNELVVTGCNVQATVRVGNDTVVSGCSSFCSSGAYEFHYGRDGSKYCSGIGCCQAPIPVGDTSLEVRFQRLDDDDPAMRRLKPVHVFVAEVDWFDHKVGRDILRPNPKRGDRGSIRVPVILQWAIWPLEVETAASAADTVFPPPCDAAVARNICRSEHSFCTDTGRGYQCSCKDNYQGNPYLVGGCVDVNECELPPEDSGCFGDCTNTDGGFHCRCPRGTHGDPTIPRGCTRYITGLTIGLLAASGPAFLILVLIVIIVLRKIEQGRAKRLKQKFFKQNRGQLLQQLVSQRADIAERMIIPIVELEKATNNFDQNRKLGGGGHGTVYKGILSDLQVVAIKKSKVVIKREIDEFINEVAILSQINHRNVVKLFGCCLETQVPLLVYEFVTNGTLQEHLHKEDGEGSLPWRDRLRIAGETAKAIAYLHSSISIPIIHRDIKSANILLDDALTAKVSDFGASRYIPTDQNHATMTAVQGTIGYLDPMYYYTRQMTEMSDVYSFGVVLIELLTRKIPTSYKSEEGNGLVAHFNALISEGNVSQILDQQVVAEGGSEIEEVAALAASCTKYRGEERPTMRQVEMALEAFQAAKDRCLDNVVVEKSEGNNVKSLIRRTNTDEGSRQYSLEEEFLMSASYPR